MFRERIDERKLKRDIAEGAAECTALKRALRTRWTRPMAEEQQRLHRVRRRVTELLVLRARLRVRFHVTSAPRALRDAGATWDKEAWHDKIADRVALDYARAEAEVGT